MDFPEMSLGEFLRRRAQASPNARALWFLEDTMTYAQLDDLVDRCATGLARLGLKQGDVLALVLPNCFQYVVAYYAAARLGAVVTGVNPTYKAQEVLHQLKICGVNAIVYLDVLHDKMLAPIMDKLHQDLRLKFTVATNIVDLVHFNPLKKLLGKILKKIPTGRTDPNSETFRTLLDHEPNVPDVRIDVHGPATYIMTGGTTGVPKAAVLSHHNCVSNALQCKAWLFRVAEGLCNVGALPLFHSFAMTTVMNTSVAVGAWQMLFPQPPPTEEFLALVRRHCPDDGTAYCGAEILFKRIADLPGVERLGVNKKFSLCISGAGPLHKPVQEKFEAVTGAKLVEGYGLTEASPVVSAGPFWGTRKIGSIGLPFPGTDWKIVDLDDPAVARPMVNLAETEPDEAVHYGEIAVAGPQVMTGYLNRPDETADTIVEQDGKRWLLTGDVGYMDSQGAVYIRDRKKQLIKLAGYSVYPKEVEELMGGHEAVCEVAVAGIPDKDTGEKIKAWVQLRPEWKGRLGKDELFAWCKRNMTHYKVPAYIEYVDEIPKSPVGKVLRRELQEADPLYKSFFAAKQADHA